MNYYQPRQKKDGGLWHYTCQNDGRIWPVGYCGQGCAGHDDADGARAHHRDYLLDTATYDSRMTGQQRPCEVCRAWTQRIAAAGPGKVDTYVLCDEHCNRDGLARVMDAPGDSVSSW